MKIINAEIIDSPIEHVYQCLTDLKFYKEDIKRQINDDTVHVKLQHDRKDPFDPGKTINVIVNDQSLYHMRIITNDKPTNLVAEIIPAEKAGVFFGSFLYDAKLKAISQDKTEYIYSISSQKNPTHLLTKILAAIAKFFISISIARTNKRFLSYVKSTKI